MGAFCLLSALASPRCLAAFCSDRNPSIEAHAAKEKSVEAERPATQDPDGVAATRPVLLFRPVRREVQEAQERHVRLGVTLVLSRALEV